MNEDQKRKVNEWLRVLKEYIDPVQIMDRFPHLFPLGSLPRNRVMNWYNQPHKSVEIVVEKLFQCYSEENLFQRFIGAVRETGHSWLAELITGGTYGIEAERPNSAMESGKYVANFFTLILPHLSSILQPRDVVYQLKTRHVFTDEEVTQVEAKIQDGGAHAAVRHMLAILVRKAPGWWRDFNDIIEDLNYDADLVKSLRALENDMNSSSSSFNESCRMTVREEGNTDNMASSITNAMSSGSDMWERAIAGKNVMIILPFECGKAWTVTHMAQARFQTLKGAVGFIVETNDKAKVYHKEIQTLLTNDELSVTCLAGGGKQLNTVIDSFRIIVMTPMKMVNAFASEGKSLLFKFDMLIFDDCEPVMQEKPVDNILHEYFRLEDSRNFTRPQIVGLASVSSIPLRKDRGQDDLLSLCAKYDVSHAGQTTIPLGYKDDIFRPMEMVLNSGTVDECISDPITLSISKAIDEVTQQLCRPDSDITKIRGFSDPKSLPKGTKRYIKWCKDMLRRAVVDLPNTDVKKSMDIQKSILVLLTLNEALDLMLTCRATDAMKHLVSTVQTLRDNDSKEAEHHLYDITKKCIENIEKNLGDPRCANKALHQIKEKLQAKFQKDRDCKVLILVPWAGYVKPMKYWLEELGSNGCSEWNKVAVFGLENEEGTITGLESCNRKLQQRLQDQTAAIVICTPVIASGLSVNCNFVIYYNCLDAKLECADSIMLRSVQLTIKEKPEVSASLLVEAEIENFKAAYKDEEDLYNQEKKKKQVIKPEAEVVNSEESMADRGRNNMVGNQAQNDVAQPDNSRAGKVICRGKDCNTFVCYVTDIEVLATNYTCAAAEFKTRYVTRIVPDGGTEKKEGLFCRKCNSRWGIFTTYRALSIPLLKPVAFLFYKTGDENCAPVHGKKWESITATIDFKRVTYDEMFSKLVGN